jgi:hypothetical protein
MSDIKEKALALVKRFYPECPDDYQGRRLQIAMAAIERHEATKQEYSDFRQEVSNAVKQADLLDLHGTEGAYKKLHRFIIAKPDPLVEALAESGREFGPDWGWEEQAKALRAALEARGLEIREKGQ